LRLASRKNPANCKVCGVFLYRQPNIKSELTSQIASHFGNKKATKLAAFIEKKAIKQQAQAHVSLEVSRRKYRFEPQTHQVNP
jgi:plastocyanin